MQITEFVKQRIPTQLHSEADASKDGQIRPHIRRPYPTGAGYDWILKFARISARAGYDIRCNPSYYGILTPVITVPVVLPYHSYCSRSVTIEFSPFPWKLPWLLQYNRTLH